MPVDVVLWKDDDTWRGECIDLPASVSGATLRAVYDDLVNACHAASLQALREGRLPGRLLDEVDPEVLARWESLESAGSRVDVQHLCRTDGDGRTQVRLSFHVRLNTDVAGLHDDLDLGTLRAVLLSQEGTWFAQCLEHDLCATGDTPQEAIDALQRTIDLRVAVDRTLGHAPLSHSPKADQHFWDLYERGERLPVQSPVFHVSLSQAA